MRQGERKRARDATEREKEEERVSSTGQMEREGLHFKTKTPAAWERQAVTQVRPQRARKAAADAPPPAGIARRGRHFYFM